MYQAIIWLIALFCVCFLLGSVPWGVVISRIFYHKDIRSVGSGNIGTTNAMRAMGKGGGVAVFLLDFGKGLLSGFLGLLLANAFYSGSISYSPLSTSILGGICVSMSFLGCVLGHIFSPWLKFRGGKGIAVAGGCLFFTFGPVGGAIELLVFAVFVLTTRYVSVGSIAAAVACPILSFWFLPGNWVAIAFCWIGAAFVIWAHRGNIARLREGCERRIGGSKESEGA